MLLRVTESSSSRLEQPVGYWECSRHTKRVLWSREIGATLWNSHQDPRAQQHGESYASVQLCTTLFSRTHTRLLGFKNLQSSPFTSRDVVKTDIGLNFIALNSCLPVCCRHTVYGCSLLTSLFVFVFESKHLKCSGWHPHEPLTVPTNILQNKEISCA